MERLAENFVDAVNFIAEGIIDGILNSIDGEKI